MKRRKALAAVAAVLVLSSALLVGCNKDADTTPDEATVSASTSASSTASVETKSTEPQTDKADEASPTKSLANEKPQTEYNEPENIYVPDNNDTNEPEDGGVCTINVDGKTYEAMVGDTVTYVFNLKTPEALEDFQATTTYDSGMLMLVSKDTKDMFPVAGEIVVCNTELENMVKYNAVNLSGMDFTKGGVFISLDFKVLDSGGTSVGTTLEYMDSVTSQPYVNDYRIVGDFDYSEEIKLGN